MVIPTGEPERECLGHPRVLHGDGHGGILGRQVHHRRHGQEPVRVYMYTHQHFYFRAGERYTAFFFILEATIF